MHGWEGMPALHLGFGQLPRLRLCVCMLDNDQCWKLAPTIPNIVIIMLRSRQGTERHQRSITCPELPKIRLRVHGTSHRCQESDVVGAPVPQWATAPKADSHDSRPAFAAHASHLVSSFVRERDHSVRFANLQYSRTHVPNADVIVRFTTLRLYDFIWGYGVHSSANHPTFMISPQSVILHSLLH